MPVVDQSSMTVQLIVWCCWNHNRNPRPLFLFLSLVVGSVAMKVNSCLVLCGIRFVESLIRNLDFWLLRLKLTDSSRTILDFFSSFSLCDVWRASSRAFKSSLRFWEVSPMFEGPRWSSPAFLQACAQVPSPQMQRKVYQWVLPLSYVYQT